MARVLRRFQLTDDATMILSTTRPTLTTSLPIGRPMAVLEVLRRHVELQQPATQQDLEVLAAHNRCPPHKDHLMALATSEERYLAEVLTPRLSVLDLLERWTSIELPLARFLELLPPMRLRRYSISSSTRVAPHKPTLTVTVVDEPALSGNGRYFGAASTYLQRVQPGDRIALGVRSTSTPFHPPENNSAPMVLIAAGSGIAPFRGFLQERAARAAAGETAGPCVLFIGCRHPDVDALYRDELAAWQRDGLVEVLPAYSRHEPAAVDADGQPVTYVQHRVWQERGRVATMLEQGAFVFLCGDGRRMAPAARAVLARILTPVGAGEDDGRRRLGVLEQQGRYVADLFA
jgi:cytochrome P450/NADPH-cytochrome P450 reductase